MIGIIGMMENWGTWYFPNFMQFCSWETPVQQHPSYSQGSNPLGFYKSKKKTVYIQTWSFYSPLGFLETESTASKPLSPKEKRLAKSEDILKAILRAISLFGAQMGPLTATHLDS